ncbi:MAG: S49 family peptidase, partial [Rhodanobacteraceae bacterium]
MSSHPPGVIVRILRGFWTALDFTRRLVFNLIFLFVVILIFAAMFAARPTLQPRTALVLDPKGAIVEQYSIDPMQRMLGNLAGERPRETQMRDLLRVIDSATKDARIERIVLLPDEIAGAGLATLHELGNALDRFRAAGKEVVAVAGDLNQGQYLLAAHADKILLDPDGAVLIEGFANYRSYFKDALDKLGVEVHLIKVGQYKSAAEPYVLNQASEASKEADRYWMGGLWTDYLAEISGLRKVDASKIDEDIAHYDERVAAHSG